MSTDDEKINTVMDGAEMEKASWAPYTYKAWATAICPITNAIFILVGIVQKLSHRDCTKAKSE